MTTNRPTTPTSPGAYRYPPLPPDRLPRTQHQCPAASPTSGTGRVLSLWGKETATRPPHTRLGPGSMRGNHLPAADIYYGWREHRAQCCATIQLDFQLRLPAQKTASLASIAALMAINFGFAVNNGGTRLQLPELLLVVACLWILINLALVSRTAGIGSYCTSPDHRQRS